MLSEENKNSLKSTLSLPILSNQKNISKIASKQAKHEISKIITQTSEPDSRKTIEKISETEVVSLK